ncbi:AAA family ATPase [Erythrobacter sp. 3-20A1M]|uniref:XrtA/PEP-CTERM system-associated ATPase n=1 Tax=Erythrobacter sp. 3-20A1M TaxID=2653850 RepID=UPI001BFC1611|nr:XrtA/PEP-CTERM system-associated ATPase [Erythrobacter sp. 3-20A1M]QWC55744.1 AAA family ATPase [Erythrobacter sp. 3-20A1M]
MFDDFYGLTGRPFQLTPDPAFYFESATHRKALSYLGYGMAQGEGFIVITGEIGAGKSTLVAHLTKKIDPEQMTVGQIVTSSLDGEEMVHLVAQSFGLAVEGRDKASALGEIEAFLHEEARAGRRCLLVVDESQNLSSEALEELRMMSNYQLGSHPLLQQLLLGQPEFKAMLADSDRLEQLRQRVIATHHLGAMQREEVRPYIEHRLKCVGWQGEPAWDDDVFAGIFAATGGIPRRINQVATRLLLLGAVDQRTRIDAAMLRSVLEEMDSDNSLPGAAETMQDNERDTPGGSREPDPIQDHAESEEPAEPEDDGIFAGGFALDADAFDDLQPATYRGSSPSADIARPFEKPVEARDEAPVEDQDDDASPTEQPVPFAVVARMEPEPAAEPDTGREDRDALLKRIEMLEARLEEQERGVRHVIALLIEWLEDGAREAA